MTYRGHIRNRTVVLDEPVQLPEGTRVTVEVGCETGAAMGSDPAGRDGWQTIEDEIKMLRHSAADLTAQELIPPTAAALKRMETLVAELRQQQIAPPFRAVPNGDGGLVLEWIDAAAREIVRSIEVSEDGAADQSDFHNNQRTALRSLA